MQLKGPFKLTEQNFYFLPSRPGVYLLGNQDGRVVYVGKSDNLAERVKKHVKTSHVPGATQFWYSDTWSAQEADNLEKALIKKYVPSGNTVVR